ncbi:MAG: type II toxin-antitoxin system VapC family toxin [Chloroflexi bacterium]|nr:type II toxin-antitoxin system VapC family toxin [Chloroflexota bacterium]
MAASVLGLIDRAPALRIAPIAREHVLVFDRLGDIAEMHDRFIAAVGFVNDAAIITRDAAIRASHAIRSVWA